MRLFEAIIEANHRAVAGDASAGLRPAEFADSLPVAALTCIDPRLNPLIPEVLGIPEEQFVWLRNAGNVVTGPLSSTMRSLALACAVEGAREIVIIGHADCHLARTPTLQLLECLKTLGIERDRLPDNVNDFFALFASERQNVLRACELVRGSPLIGPRIPVHGLLVDLESGRLEWVVNGYQTWATLSERFHHAVQAAGQTVDALRGLADFQIGEMKFPETKIGETVTHTADWLGEKLAQLEVPTPTGPAPAPPVQKAIELLDQAAQVVEQVRSARTRPPPPPKRQPLPPRIAPKPDVRGQSGR